MPPFEDSVEQVCELQNALSAAPVAQEPVAWRNGEMSNFTKRLCNVERDRVTAAEICIDELITIMDRHGVVDQPARARLPEGVAPAGSRFPQIITPMLGIAASPPKARRSLGMTSSDRAGEAGRMAPGEIAGKFYWPSAEYSIPADNLCWHIPPAPDRDFRCVRTFGHPGKCQHEWSPTIKDHSHRAALSAKDGR